MPLLSNTKRLTTLALLAAVTLVLSWVDSLIPVSGLAPGMKLGLANLAVLAGIYLLGNRQGAVLCILKILLTTALFGNAFSFFYSAAGGLFSYLVMILLKHLRCSTVFVSLMGGVFHNLAQVAVAAVVLQTAGLMGYFPILLLGGLGAGAAVGAVGAVVLPRCQKALKLSKDT